MNAPKLDFFSIFVPTIPATLLVRSAHPGRFSFFMAVAVAASLNTAS